MKLRQVLVRIVLIDEIESALCTVTRLPSYETPVMMPLTWERLKLWLDLHQCPSPYCRGT